MQSEISNEISNEIDNIETKIPRDIKNINLLYKTIETIRDNKIRAILEIISKNYPNQFKKEYIDIELEYIIKHITININTEQLKVKAFTPDKNKTFKKHIKLKNIKCKKEIIQKQILDTSNIQIPKTLLILKNKNENQCSARTWNNTIFDRITLLKVKDVDIIFKVTDFKDINIDKFNKKYILGVQCKKNKCKYKNSEYCKLHTLHLIHGDYTTMPNKELCYHFMKDGKYL